MVRRGVKRRQTGPQEAFVIVVFNVYTSLLICQTFGQTDIRGAGDGIIAGNVERNLGDSGFYTSVQGWVLDLEYSLTMSSRMGSRSLG